jgi:cobalt-zinc-cadmium efflux system outer membrane protein
MKRRGYPPLGFSPSLLGVLPLGCVALALGAPARAAPPSAEAVPEFVVPFSPQAAPLAAAGTPAQSPAPPGVAPELGAEALVAQVLARNPSLAQMVAAWQAASARYPQVTSLDDPMVGAMVAPASIGSDDVEFGYRVEVSQKYPFPGKLRLRGQNAQAEASAAGHDVEDMRLQLVESARGALADYYLAARALTVNEEALRLVRAAREKAQQRYERRVPEANQGDILQAEVEEGRQRRRQLTLERMRQVAVARINTLLHLPPDSPLPPPPDQLDPGTPLPDVSVLRVQALARRPDLHALADHIRAEEAALGLAHKDFYPDFEVMAAYDTVMGNGPMRDLAPQLAVRINLPVRTARRYGALAEAEARLAGRRAELEKQIDQVNLQVQEAYEQIRESQRVVALYRETILRAARGNVEAARSAYESSRVPFVTLIEAERNAVDHQDSYYEAVADAFRRRATLERVAGGALAPEPPTPGPAGACSAAH